MPAPHRRKSRNCRGRSLVQCWKTLGALLVVCNEGSLSARRALRIPRSRGSFGEPVGGPTRSRDAGIEARLEGGLVMVQTLDRYQRTRPWLALLLATVKKFRDAAQHAMNSVWDLPIRERPKFIARKLRSLLMLVVIGSGLFLTAGSSAVANAADSTGATGRIVAPLFATVVNIGVFAVAFRILTERDLRWSDVVPGASVAGTAATLFQVAGGFIMARYLRGASQTYGTFAVVIGLLSWLHLQAQVTLFAAEVNVVRARRTDRGRPQGPSYVVA